MFSPAHAPVSRCTKCKRAFAPHFGGEKTAAELTYPEVVIEKGKIQAKIERLNEHAEGLVSMTAAFYPVGNVCNTCGQGWREFDNRTKDLRQLDALETRAALTETRTLLAALMAQESKLLAAMKTAASAANTPSRSA